MFDRRFPQLVKPVSARQRAHFVSLVPLIRKQVRFAFRYLPSSVRQECVDDAVAQAFILFAQLAYRKRVRLAYPTALARYAAHRVRSGRLIGSGVNSCDVLSRAAQRRYGFRLVSLEQASTSAGREWRDLLSESPRTTPAELAAFRVDFSSWLHRLSNRRRKIALSLARGERSSAVARRFRISRGRISQIRNELAVAWHAFHGELESPQPTSSGSPVDR